MSHQLPPCNSPLALLLQSKNVSAEEFAHATLMDLEPIHTLIRDGSWPLRVTLPTRQRVIDFLTSLGATTEQIRSLRTPEKKRLALGGRNRTKAVPQEAREPNPYEEDPMLLQKENLTAVARKHFSITRSPFADDIHTVEDVYQSPSVRYARAVLADCAAHCGFVALVGESGAGKSTLAEDLEERIRRERKETVIIRPFVQAMSENDRKGKTLKSAGIAESVVFALDPSASVALSTQARFRQIQNLLMKSAETGRNHLLIVEEAHDMPDETLKHLKRLLEIKNGLRRLLGIALIAQPELIKRVSPQNPKLREVAQRLEIVHLEALNNDLAEYLAHKFARAGLKVDDVLDNDVVDAIRARLVRVPRGGSAADATSMCYPLVVNNLVCRAMNAAAENGFDKVTAEVIAGC